jgi:hypothetical protein
MLSEPEQRVLDQIERELEESDPQFAARLSGSPRVLGVWWAILAGLGWVAAVWATLSGWWVVTVFLLGPLIAITAAWLLERMGRFPRRG